MTVREYTDKYENLYKYAKDVYPTEEMKNEKFRDGLHISLRGKLNLYDGKSFRGWVKKAMEQERLDKELETVSRVKSQQYEGISKQPWRRSGIRSQDFSHIQGITWGQEAITGLRKVVCM